MLRFAEGQRVLVKGDANAFYLERGYGYSVRHYLASTPGTVVSGGEPEVGLYLVRFNLGEKIGSVVKTMDHRDLEA